MFNLSRIIELHVILSWKGSVRIWGASSSTQPPLWWRTCSWYPTWTYPVAASWCFLKFCCWSTERRSAPASLLLSWRSYRPQWGLLFSGLNKPKDLNHPSYTLLSRPFSTFAALPWSLCSTFMSLILYCGAPNCLLYSRWGHTSREYSRSAK